MPTVLRVGPYRLFFYSSDGGEPAHVHIERDPCVAKVWLEPVRLARSRGYGRASCAISPGWSRSTHSSFWRPGMSISVSDAASIPALATSVAVTDDALTVELADGRSVSVPLAWYPRLQHATAGERLKWRLIAQGEGIHWPDIE
jgi:hypothetical protein